MRRGFSIFLILLFGLGPLQGALEASDDSRLPACCRRHGAHHCAMSMEMATMMARAESGSGQSITAPSTCPMFPGFTMGPTAPADALAACVANLPILLEQAHLAAAEQADARMRPIRNHAGRGPPTPRIS